MVLPNATEITYAHDALGRRVAKAVDEVVVEKYLWAGMNQGLLAVYDGSDNLVVRFEYAGGQLPVAMTYSTDSYYLAYDQVGSLRAIFDEIGNKIHEITYDSFGNILTESGTFAGPVPFGFAGGLHDRDTGLVRFGYRDYDPAIGRWTAKDPIGFAGGDVNLYGYALSAPVRGIDSDGLWTTDAIDALSDPNSNYIPTRPADVPSSMTAEHWLPDWLDVPEISINASATFGHGRFSFNQDLWSGEISGRFDFVFPPSDRPSFAVGITCPPLRDTLNFNNSHFPEASIAQPLGNLQLSYDFDGRVGVAVRHPISVTPRLRIRLLDIHLGQL